MKSFSELLSEYILRLGISDAELARSIGVRRQTIFRWREGLTARPRHRDDVTRLAEKLRLTPEERDTLLLAAGFSPQTADMVKEKEASQVEAKPSSRASVNPTTDVPSPPSPQPATTGNLSPPPVGEAVPYTVEPQRAFPLNLQLMGGLAGLILLFVIVSTVSGWFTPFNPVALRPTDTPIPEKLETPTLTPTPVPEDVPKIPTAMPGETVILITHFKNYAGVGYNVRDRLQAALEDEINAANIEAIRVEAWDEEIGQRRFAIQAGQAISATLIIFGEYDAGRIVAQFVNPSAEQEFKDRGWIQEVEDLKALSAVINQDLPEQIRPLALLILGQIYVTQERFAEARLILDQARDAIKGDEALDDDTRATLNLYRGLAYSGGQEPRYDLAIMAYSEALEINPRFSLAQFNRSRAYHARQLPGDLKLALADVNTVLPRYINKTRAYNNRAAILLDIGGAENIDQARIDLDKALAQEPDLVSGLVNRSLIAYLDGEPLEAWLPDLERALEKEPTHAKALNMLCWGYGINEQAELGFPYCEAAVNEDPSPVIRDSRGLVHGLLGNVNEAIADFEVYIAWLRERDRRREAEGRQGWVDALKNGDNPFTPEVMAQLRNEG